MDQKDVKLTPEEIEEYRKLKAEKEAKERNEKNREAYKAIVSETVDKQFEVLEALSEVIKSKKNAVYEAFYTALNLKHEIYGVKEDQMSHTFVNEDGSKRIILGYYSIDYYDDTVNEGIAKVKQAVDKLVSDENSKVLVQAVMRLLSRDKKGNLQPSRVMQLRKIAEEQNNLELIDGVNIIEKSHNIAKSKTFIRAEKKNENGAWVSVPLSITEG